MFDTLSYLNYFFLLFLCFIIFYYKKITIKIEPQKSNLHFKKVTSFLEKHGGTHTSHLIFLEDKEIYWAQDQNVLIVYKQVANKLVVLGDPIGDESLIQDAIKEFYSYTEGKGLKAIFYQVSPKFMHHYHETGYRFIKLGEEAVVNLQTFSLTGKKGGKLRTSLNKFNRNSYQFSVLKPPYSNQLLSDLKLISDSWLGEQKEKSFSVVSFNQGYVSRFPVALLSDPHGNIIAFATLATDYHNSVSIDLMRKLPNSPNGTMDVLFIHIFNWAEEAGYRTCSLGMAPLSNVGTSKHSFMYEKLMYLAYQYGGSLYNFKGLKEFKSKFACSWEPKYLAYKKTSLSVTFLQLLFLINAEPNKKSKVAQKIKYLFKKVG